MFAYSISVKRILVNSPQKGNSYQFYLKILVPLPASEIELVLHTDPLAYFVLQIAARHWNVPLIPLKKEHLST